MLVALNLLDKLNNPSLIAMYTVVYYDYTDNYSRNNFRCVGVVT